MNVVGDPLPQYAIESMLSVPYMPACLQSDILNHVARDSSSASLRSHLFTCVVCSGIGGLIDCISKFRPLKGEGPDWGK